MVKINHGRYRHGYSDTRLYSVWSNMKGRCKRQNNDDYHRYGGRGIKVCDSWDKDFVNFKDWALKNGYKDCLSIDRINVNGDYEPSNCRWVTMKEQSTNKENTLIIEHKGKKYFVSELAKELNIPMTTIWYRHKNNIPVDLDKRVVQIDKNNKIINVYENVEEVIRQTGFTSIRKVFQGKCKTAGGYTWTRVRQDGTADKDKGYV